MTQDTHKNFPPLTNRLNKMHAETTTAIADLTSRVDELEELQTAILTTPQISDTVLIPNTASTITLSASSLLAEISVVGFEVTFLGKQQTVPAVTGTATVTITAPADALEGDRLLLECRAKDNHGNFSREASREYEVVCPAIASPVITFPDGNTSSVMPDAAIGVGSFLISLAGYDTPRVVDNFAYSFTAKGKTEAEDIVIESGFKTFPMSGGVILPAKPLPLNMDIELSGRWLGHTLESETRIILFRTVEFVPWLATLGCAGGYSVEAFVASDKTDSTYAVARSTAGNFGGVDIVIVKFDKHGIKVWDRYIGGIGDDFSYAVTTDKDYFVYLAGYSSSAGASGGYDALIVKYDKDGNKIWDRFLGGTGNDIINCIAIDSDCHAYVVGNTNSGIYGAEDAFIAKYSNDGELLWSRYLGGSGNDFLFYVDFDSAGDVYAAGYSTSAGGLGGFDMLIVKYNKDGEKIWDRYLGSSADDLARGIAFDAKNNFYVAGRSSSGGFGGFDVVLAKFTTDGEKLWDIRYGGSGDDVIYAVAVDRSGNIGLAGHSTSAGVSGGYDTLIVKFTTDGEKIWDRYLGSSADDMGRGIAFDSAANIVVSFRNHYVSSHDACIAKLYPDAPSASFGKIFTLKPANLTLKPANLTLKPAALTSTPTNFSSKPAGLTSKTANLPVTLHIGVAQ